VELIAEIWRRATSAQPAPPAYAIALVALLALGLVLLPAIWPYTRMLVTITHEGGHALAAVATGRRLQGIRLHADTSGLTLSSGRPRGPGMVITLLAGYLAPAIVGLGAVGMLILGYSLGLLWLFVILLALLLLQIRNFYGFAVIVGVAVVLVAVSWYASATVQSTLAYLLTWILLISAPKPVIELIGQRRRRRGRQSDADQLSRLTRTPATLWALLFLVVNLAGLVVGTALLLPALAQLAVGAAHQLAAR
jgi:hypothetical protein